MFLCKENQPATCQKIAASVDRCGRLQRIALSQHIDVLALRKMAGKSRLHRSRLANLKGAPIDLGTSKKRRRETENQDGEPNCSLKKWDVRSSPIDSAAGVGLWLKFYFSGLQSLEFEDIHRRLIIPPRQRRPTTFGRFTRKS